ncbi:MAG TPA: dual specificity protein phosphatase family protein [Acidimicrobiales bacterium]|nr:dual specificity protein phosphatase family protein [Acidimicrobiales bacterium]
MGGLLVKGLGAAVAFLVIGNLAILAASYWARETTPATRLTTIAGVDNLRSVDDHLWRGAAPTTAGYRNLAQAGVTTVVDLRAEDGLEADTRTVEALGMKLVRIPMRDGQVPSAGEVEAFLAATQESDGRVFVHCGAGVGRTGAMVGAYQVHQGELSGAAALRRNLAVGPPSLEQIAFVAKMGDGLPEKPGTVLTAVSRVLDAPRRLWSRYGG